MAIVKRSVGQALSERAAQELHDIIADIPAIRRSLERGGWICGGFVRQLMLDRPTDEYLYQFSIDRGTTRAGDIDIFFPSESVAKASAESLMTNRSMAGFAKNLTQSHGRNYINIQLVDHPDLIYPTIEETLDRFDLTNCQVGTDGAHVYYQDGWHDLEAARMVGISRNDTPFLGSRILKYLQYRGLDRLSDDSYEKLRGWFAHVCGGFEGGRWTEDHQRGIERNIKMLRARGLVRREDLIFFLNRWKHVIVEREYGQSFSYETDWALHELGQSAA